jgi:hypothetical protein
MERFRWPMAGGAYLPYGTAWRARWSFPGYKEKLFTSFNSTEAAFFGSGITKAASRR